MQELKLFSIYDTKALAYLPPFFLPQRGQAMRTFGDCCNDKSHAFGAHPEDYTLFYLGTFDDTTARFVLEPAPHSLGKGSEFVRESEEHQGVLDFETPEIDHQSQPASQAVKHNGLDPETATQMETESQ